MDVGGGLEKFCVFYFGGPNIRHRKSKKSFYGNRDKTIELISLSEAFLLLGSVRP